ncbi:hypothetical protein M413DRAFT_124664 [Hebeloma cylindrosporum]|uniref:F-box domain-containing protein n=1 Tax=Hebeloma cylindrosporum TaxID=76867 RepID=A0A0C3C1Q3_HEBCY|nr:hypothetical protein M413DRAFT_124664 [Hebeloma cylindrosporum h7]
MLLPRDIVDLIIDEVSRAEKSKSQLTTCSLVCRSFHSRARTHLFSPINLCVELSNSYEDRRAGKLVRILKYKKNSDLISHIVRSVKVLVGGTQCPYECQESGWSSSGSFLSPEFALTTHRYQHRPLCQVAALTLLKRAPIEKLVLEGLNGPFFENPSFRVPTLLFEMCSNPNLKTLGIENLRDLPYTFLFGPPDRARSFFTRLVLPQCQDFL